LSGLQTLAATPEVRSEQESRISVIEDMEHPNQRSDNPSKIVDTSGLTEQHRKQDLSYVLVTAAYNEESNIEKTIESVLSQTLLPARWVIVSDGSFDRTDEIVQTHVKKHSFIHFLRMQRSPGRSFRSKVVALQTGIKLLDDVRFEFIGNLDADVAVGSSYFKDLIGHFESRPRLGLAGGFVYEDTDGEFRSRKSNRVYSVAHAAQLVRRECYEAIGGYAVLEFGGEDWHAQTSAKMRGWEIEALPELKIFHHRHTGEADNLVRHKFRQGRMDYSLGSDPLFEILKCLERLRERPFFIGSIARVVGFSWSFFCRDNRPVSEEFVAFLRREQKQKVLSLLNDVTRHLRLQILR
jgi:poly-beta-1,6-N-acetyl-D-glucosamine synthase